MSDQDTKMSELDKAIAAAKARKAQKATGAPATATGSTEKVTKKNDAEKAQKLAERKAAQERRATERAEKRAAALLLREASRKPAHMSKVEKAAAKLPGLTPEADLVFNDIITNFGRAQVAALAAHLEFFNRKSATERALAQKLEVGSVVRIVSGDPRYVGKTGVVSRAQRIRCYVEVDGLDKPCYLFTSDVEVIQSASDIEVDAPIGDQPIESKDAPVLEATGTDPS